MTGFIRVYSKDIYQLRLSNVLLSKSGASGVRTGQLTLSAVAEKKKKNERTIHTEPVEVDISTDYTCPCGQKYKNNKSGWYRRHIATCSAFFSSPHNAFDADFVSDILNED